MTPTPDQIRQARTDAGLTQAEAAELIHVSANSWARYESGERKMDAARWELFTIKSQTHA